MADLSAALWQHLAVLTQACPDNAALEEATLFLAAFIKNPAAPALAEQLLLGSREGGSDAARLYCLQALIASVDAASKSAEGSAALRATISNLYLRALRPAEVEAPAVKEKAGLLLAELAERQFPQRWPTLLEDAARLARTSPVAAECVARALRTVVADCSSADFNNRLASSRRSEVLQGLVAAGDNIFALLQDLLVGCLASTASAAGGEGLLPRGAFPPTHPLFSAAARLPFALPPSTAATLAPLILEAIGAFLVFVPTAWLRAQAAVLLALVPMAWAAAAHTFSGDRRASEALQRSVIALLDGLATRKYPEGAADADVQGLALLLAAALLGATAPLTGGGGAPAPAPGTSAAATCLPQLWPALFTPCSPFIARLSPELYRSLAAAVSEAGANFLPTVVGVAQRRDGPLLTAEASGGACMLSVTLAQVVPAFLAVAAGALAPTPSPLVHSLLLGPFADATVMAAAPKIPGTLAAYHALVPLLPSFYRRLARYVRADMQHRTVLAARDGAPLAYVPHLTSSADGLSPGAIEIIADDCGGDALDDYTCVYTAIKARATAVLSGVLGAHLPQAVLSVAQAALAEAHAAATSSRAGGPDMPTRAGTCSFMSTAVRAFDAAGCVLEALVNALPAAALAPAAAGSPLASQMEALIAALLHAANATTDPLLRSRQVSLLGALHRWYGAFPGATLAPVMTLLFDSFSMVPTPAAAAAVAAAPDPAAALAAVKLDCVYAQEKACSALIRLCRFLAPTLLPVLTPMTERAAGLLASGVVAPQSRVSLMEALVLVSNELGRNGDAAGHARFLAQIASHSMSAWASPAVAAAVASPAAFLSHLGLGPSAPPSPDVNPSAVIERAEALLSQLHLLWAVARRVDAYTGPSPHPFHDYWPSILPHVLQLLSTLHGLWGASTCVGVMTSPGAPGASDAAAPASVMLARAFYTPTEAELASLGQARKGAGPGGDEDDEGEESGAGEAAPAAPPPPGLVVAPGAQPLLGAVLAPPAAGSATAAPTWHTLRLWTPPDVRAVMAKLSTATGRAQWHAYSIVTFAARASVASRGAVGLLSPSLVGPAWPFLKQLLSGDATSHLPLRFLRTVAQQLVPKLVAAASAVAEDAASRDPSFAGGLCHAMLDALGGFIEGALAALSKAAAAAPLGGSPTASGEAWTPPQLQAAWGALGLLPAAAMAAGPASVEAPVARVYADVCGSIVDAVAAALVPGGTSPPTAKSPPAPAAAAGHDAAAALPPAPLPAFQRACLTENVAMASAACKFLSAAPRLGDAATARKAAALWPAVFSALATGVKAPPPQGATAVAAARVWAAAASDFFQASLPALCAPAGGPPTASRGSAGGATAAGDAEHAELLGACLEIYCRLVLGFPSEAAGLEGTGLTTESVGGARLPSRCPPTDNPFFNEGPRHVLTSLPEVPLAAVAAMEDTLRRALSPKERRAALRACLQGVKDVAGVAAAAAAAAPSAAAFGELLAAPARTISNLPERLVILGRATGGAGSSAAVASGPLDEEHGLTSLFGADDLV